MPNCKTIAICNQKGGTGKTTTTVNLGVGLERLGKKVLLVDADPQGDLTTCLGWRDNDSLTTTITDKLSGVIREDHSDPQSGILHHEENVDLLPANIELSAMEMMLVTAMSRETILRSYLSKVKDNYDYVLIDCMELMLALFNIVQGTISTIMGSAGFSTPQQTVLPPELITSVEECGFFESIPLWAVTLIGGLFITVMSFILIMTVYGRFFKLYMYTALAPIPLSTFAGEPSQNVGKSFIKSYCAVCLEGAVIVLSCIIFSLFASSPPVVNPDAAAVTQVWSYVSELLFNMLVLVGSVKMSDRIIREMMGL